MPSASAKFHHVESVTSMTDPTPRMATAIATAEAEIQQAEAAVKTAQINLDYTKITAPISGRIGRSMVTDGAIVTGNKCCHELRR